ncbi:LuxR C-terminal-related transcriptional regulator [Undibacterium sp. SXout11W]|uniref:LuxR C-terminal-related transcriptional regulator n=1 Tax=Undibacterium sp. SXout11W TaxID=3413050 RepID=UPI003BF3A9C9
MPNQITKDLSLFIDQLPGVIYQFFVFKNGDWKFLLLSNHIRDLYEVSPEEAYENHFVITNQIIPDDRADHRKSIEDAVNQRRNWAHLHRIRNPSGTLKWVFAQASLSETNIDGSLWSGVLTDVTDLIGNESQVIEFIQKFEDSLKIRQTEIGREIHFLDNLRRRFLSDQVQPGVCHDKSVAISNTPSPIDVNADPFVRSKKAARSGESLSARELEILMLIAKGGTSKSIADKLNIALTTVNAHRRNMKKKLNMTTTNQMMQYAILHYQQVKF